MAVDKVAADQCYEPPQEAERQPGEAVDEGEDEETEPPFEVYQSGEEVAQVAVGLGDVAVVDITLALLLNVALPQPLGCLGDETCTIRGDVGLCDVLRESLRLNEDDTLG